jgi:hypothetical protein
VTVLAVTSASAVLMGWWIWPQYLGRALRWLAVAPSNHVTAYQTVQSLAGHLFVYEATWNPTPVTHLPALAGIVSVLVIASLFGLSLRRQRLGSEDLTARALTVGMFIAPLPAVAPIGEGHHYILVFPAVLIGFWWAFRAPATTRDRLLVVACAALICVPQRFYGAKVLQHGWNALLAYPRVYGALALWGVLARALHTPNDDDRQPDHASG